MNMPTHRYHFSHLTHSMLMLFHDDAAGCGLIRSLTWSPLIVCGRMQTAVTAGNYHEVNPRDKVGTSHAMAADVLHRCTADLTGQCPGATRHV